ncbi:hypothetical protein ACFPMF_01480 [Larkinella bovis]|uniref:Uncharacterized protein n=1 Tax=Larkinella bovis TaxID=683041 RepID=A0ABW0I367_9BACT
METLKPVTLPNPKDRKKFKCTVYTKKGTVFAKKIYTAYNEYGAQMQLDEWLAGQVSSHFDRKSIEIVPHIRKRSLS